jgi:hypoxanthine phosphoribosyltransferase
VADPHLVVLSESDIRHRVDELGELLTRDYAGRRPVVVGVLTGALWFLADLVREIDLDLDVDFLLLNRFGEGGRIRIQTDTAIAADRQGRDPGRRHRRHRTVPHGPAKDDRGAGGGLGPLRRAARQGDAADRRRPARVPGIRGGRRVLIGYGLDHEGLYRNLRDIWAVLDLARSATTPSSFRESVFASTLIGFARWTRRSSRW